MNVDFDTCLQVFQDRYPLNPKVRSKRTEKFHLENMQAAKKYFKEKHPSLLEDFTKITTAIIEAYLLYMLKKGLSQSTAEGRIKSMRVVLRVLYEAGVLAENIADTVHYHPNYIPKIIPFTNEQILQLLKTADKSPLGLRMIAMIMLFADTGIRLKELYNLDVCHVSFKNRTIFVRERKNGGQQFLKFGNQTSKALLQYMKAFNINPADMNAPFFQTQREGRRWAKRTLEDQLHKLGEKAGLGNVRCSPHTFRHTFALNALRNGIPGLILKELLDHQDMDMVNRYVHICNQLVDYFFVSGTDVIVNSQTYDPPSPFDN